MGLDGTLVGRESGGMLLCESAVNELLWVAPVDHESPFVGNVMVKQVP